MDIQPQTTKPISDDQELAKVLAGVNQDSSLSFEEVPTSIPAPVSMPTPTHVNPAVETTKQSASNNDLISIKKDALMELRPLVEKLNLEPEEKFDIYLLILRSTDDTTLIAPAHNAARNIVDESRRAQALLDIIKEIDYLSSPSISVAKI